MRTARRWSPALPSAWPPSQETASTTPGSCALRSPAAPTTRDSSFGLITGEADHRLLDVAERHAPLQRHLTEADPPVTVQLRTDEPRTAPCCPACRRSQTPWRSA